MAHGIMSTPAGLLAHDSLAHLQLGQVTQASLASQQLSSCLSSASLPGAAEARLPLITMIVNSGSGHHAQRHVLLAEQLRQFFISHQFEVQVYVSSSASQLTAMVQQAVAVHLQRAAAQSAWGQPYGIVVAAGGDGTLNSVAQVLQQQAIALGIIPLGTFNYVARALHIPLDPFQAAQVIVSGQPQAINLGVVNGWVYLNNASIGLYPKIIEQREVYNARFGRFRGVAMLSGFMVLMREQRKLKLKMTVDGEPTPLETPLVFFGNNQLQLQDMKLHLAQCVQHGRLAAVAITQLSRWQMLKLIHRLQRGDFENAPEVSCFCAQSIKIDARAKHMKVAIDGEVICLTTPLMFRVAHNALQVMTPQAAGPRAHEPLS